MAQPSTLKWSDSKIVCICYYGNVKLGYCILGSDNVWSTWTYSDGRIGGSLDLKEAKKKLEDFIRGAKICKLDDAAAT